MTIHLLPSKLRLLFSLICFLFLCFSSITALAQNDFRKCKPIQRSAMVNQTIGEPTIKEAIGSKPRCGSVYRVRKSITGIVTDKKGVPIPFVSVMKNGKTGIAADSAGRFSIKINEAVDSLHFSAAGYNSLTIKTPAQRNNIIIVLTNSASLPELIIKSDFVMCRICRWTCGGNTCKVRGLRVFMAVHDSSSQKTFTVYPNPAPRASQIMIRLDKPVTAACQVQLFDSKGSLLQKGTMIFKDSQSAPFLLNPIAGGIYILRMTDNEGKSKSALIEIL